MSYTPNAVVAHAFSFPDYMFTMNITGTVTRQDVGEAVTIDPAVPNAVRLAGNGEALYGRLETVETGGQDGLTVGTVARKFRALVPIATGLTGVNAVAVGDTVCGSTTPGAVRALNNGTIKTPDHDLNVVLAIVGTFALVEKL